MRRDRNNFITSPRKGNQPKKPEEFVTVIILGENHGYRMKAYGPMPLINLHGKMLIDKQIGAVKSAFTNYEIIICTGFESDRVGNYIREKYPFDNIRMVENQVYLNSNCCESTRLCLNNTLNDRIVVMGGGIDIVPSHMELFNLNKTEVVIQSQGADDNFEVGSVIVEENLGHLTFGVKGNFWTEMLFLNGRKSIELFQRIISDTDYKNKFLFEAVNALALKQVVNIALNEDKRINKIDNLKSLRKSMKI